LLGLPASELIVRGPRRAALARVRQRTSPANLATACAPAGNALELRQTRWRRSVAGMREQRTCDEPPRNNRHRPPLWHAVIYGKRRSGRPSFNGI